MESMLKTEVYQLIHQYTENQHNTQKTRGKKNRIRSSRSS